MGELNHTQTKPRLVASYVAAAALSLLILSNIIQIWHADLHIPFAYGGDSLITSMLIKSIIDHGWILQNGSLGAPGVQDMHDFPFGDMLFLASIRFISLVTKDFALVDNALYIMSFPLSTLTAFAVFRRFDVSLISALAGALLFSFMPYHFMRGENHLFLSLYFLVPLIVMIALWVHDESTIWTARKQLTASLIGILVGIGGIYYAFFGATLLLVSGIRRVVVQSSLKPMQAPLLVVAIITTMLVIDVVPNIIYWQKHGMNPVVGQRHPGEAEIYGLKITQLLLPVTGHRVLSFAEGKAKYNRDAPNVNENDFVSLGVIGSLGFLLLLGRSLRLNRNGTDHLLDGLATLNLFSVLLATTGGFGALIALSVLSEIRGYNRIGIFIAFVSLFAVVRMSDSIMQRAMKSGKPVAAWAGIALVTMFGLWDQTSPNFVPDYTGIKEHYIADSVMSKRISGVVPNGGIVFQLPYVPFPENPPVFDMKDYDEIKPYLHSHNIRWSYGAMKGRALDSWEATVAAQPPAKLVHTLESAGFSGVWVNGAGYLDHGKYIRQAMSHVLGSPITHEGETIWYFRLPKDKVAQEKS